MNGRSTTRGRSCVPTGARSTTSGCTDQSPVSLTRAGRDQSFRLRQDRVARFDWRGPGYVERVRSPGSDSVSRRCDLPAELTSPGEARAAIWSACRAWDIDDEACEDAVLVASELVANVVDALIGQDSQPVAANSPLPDELIVAGVS